MDSKNSYLLIDKEFVDKYGMTDDYIGKKIVMYEDKYKHIEKHKSEFSSQESYEFSLNNIGDIIANPDFVTRELPKNGLIFVKTLIDNTMVVVRISNSKELKVKTMYPLNTAKYNRLKNQPF